MVNPDSITMNTDYDIVQRLFPPGTKIIHFAGSPDKYTALLRSRCKSKEDFRENWLNKYEKLSRVTMRVLLTRPKTGKTVVYKAAFRCQHNTYPASHQRVKAPHRKHTGCPAQLKVTIKASPENRRVRSTDPLRGEFPTIISISHEHNHLLPNKRNFCGNYCNPCEKAVTRLSELSCEAFPDACIDGNFKKKEELETEELNWNLLKNYWSSFLERCESSNSAHLYRALLQVTNYLDNCKTVNATVAALNCVGKKIKQQKYDAEVLVHNQRNKVCNRLTILDESLSAVKVSSSR